MEEEEQQKGSPSWIGTLVQLGVLAWSLGVISISYFGNTVRQIDTTFAAGLLSASLSNFGLKVKGNNTNNKNRDSLKINPPNKNNVGVK